MAERILSPGVFTREKDLSFLPQEIEAIGAAVVGPTIYGPAFQPTIVSTYEEYVRAFGLSFISGSGIYQQEIKYLTNYTAQEYLRYGDTLTVVRILNNGYQSAYSYVVSTGSYRDAGIATHDRTGSGVFATTDASFKLHLLSPGVFGNTGGHTGSDIGIGNPADEQSGGVLLQGSRVGYRWEVTGVNKNRGTFDLLIRRADDRHNKKVIVEEYNDVSLDPNDSNYIARVIGDRTLTLRYDSDLVPFLQESGSYLNRSRVVRVEVLKPTLNFLDAPNSITGSYIDALPFACSGTFAHGSDGYVMHPRKFYSDIWQNNTQGFVVSPTATPSSSRMQLDGVITSDTTQGGGGYIAYRDAIDILSNQDEYDINMLMLPGLMDQANGHSDLYTHAINMVESRGDVFLLVDPTLYGSTKGQAIIAAEGRNTSYAAMYYPWVQVPDSDLQRNVWLPPSCLIAGVISFNDYIKYPWYAPAGLNRGPIDQALQTERKLTHADRDYLYESNVNPIATFPRDGVVVWGQKTLQKKRSALDRINVRRLLIAAKKFVASSVRYLVFEQNTDETRKAFKAIVNPYFEDVRRKQGLYDFKVISDESNNTADVIDRNELRGAIYLKPTKTAEFIIVDFFILPTGAVFPGD